MEDNVTITRKEYIHLLECKVNALKYTLSGDPETDTPAIEHLAELITHLNDVKALSLNPLD